LISSKQITPKPNLLFTLSCPHNYHRWPGYFSY
jgi:hypothetical protein